MAITVNGAILRNMPEQISKNVEDIADLQTTSENHETRIAALENDVVLAASFQDTTMTGTTTITGDVNQTSGDLAVTNNATIGGTLGVTGTVTASNDLDVGGDLSVGVDASVAGDLAVTGAITGGTVGPMENIVDSSGNDRFQSFSIVFDSATYGDAFQGLASLNGHSLNIVGIINRSELTTDIGLGEYFANIAIPSWLGDLIYTWLSGDTFVRLFNTQISDPSLTPLTIELRKASNTNLRIRNASGASSSAITYSASNIVVAFEINLIIS